MQVCLDKKLTTAEELRAAAEQLEARPGSNLGAKLTVKAWTDPAFKVNLETLLTLLLCAATPSMTWLCKHALQRVTAPAAVLSTKLHPLQSLVTAFTRGA